MLIELYKKIEAIIADSEAEFGICIRHIESEQEVTINADTLFVLASVVKVPVLVETFSQVNEGRLSLDDRWSLSKKYKSLGSGILTYLDDGLCLTVRDLLTLMIIISDNTATDMLIDRLQINCINKTIQALGLNDLHIARTLHNIFEDMLPSADPYQDMYELARYHQDHGVNQDGFSYQRNPENNVGSPRALTLLMEMIFKGEVVSPEACDSMLNILLKQQLNDRLPLFLPVGTRVAHKTGSFVGVRNDTGIIYVNQDSHVVLTTLTRWNEAAYLKDATQERERCGKIDAAMAEIALAAYQQFGGV